MSNSTFNNTEKLQFNDKSEEHLWIQHSPVCTKIVDLDFNLQFMSSAGIKDLEIDDITTFYGKPYPLYFYPESFRIQMINSLEIAKETSNVVNQIGSVLDINNNELWYSSTIVPVKKDDKFNSIMIISINITDQKRAEFSLKNANEELKSSIISKTDDLIIANSKLETLEGIISICSYCKSIRNKEGSWDVLEKYIMEHSVAKISHGVCPDCFKRESEKIKTEL